MSCNGENEIGTVVIESAIEVHRRLGNRLLESVYETALAIELADRCVNGLLEDK